ncbi:MAG: hypothetical protein RBQ97_08225 [Acholeplasma sp.]|nr:hypothetical protein [Acholeplasma sp.]
MDKLIVREVKNNGFKKTFIRDVIIVILLLAIVVLFALFKKNILKSDEYNEITVGEETIINVTPSDHTSLNLVPKGTLLGKNETDEIILTYLVSYNKSGRISVDIENITIGDGDNNFNDLIVVQVFTNNPPSDYAPILGFYKDVDIEQEKSFAISFRILISEPLNENDYDAATNVLKNNKISFHSIFKIF